MKCFNCNKEYETVLLSKPPRCPHCICSLEKEREMNKETIIKFYKLKQIVEQRPLPQTSDVNDRVNDFQWVLKELINMFEKGEGK